MTLKNKIVLVPLTFNDHNWQNYPKIMKVETTITIEADLLKQVEIAAKDFHSSSEVFEKALLQYLPKLNQKSQKRKLTREEEIEVLNRIGTEQREEILETLRYQADL